MIHCCETPWFYWVCPKCGERGMDPQDYRISVCANGHGVQLGEYIGFGEQRADLLKPTKG